MDGVVGLWCGFSCDVVVDFKCFYDLDVDSVDVVVIMIDSDNIGVVVEVCYELFFFLV